MTNNLEFFGLPGSGKTTIYKSILQELSRCGIPHVAIDRHATKILVPPRRRFFFDLFYRLGRKELNRLPDHLSSAKFRLFSEFVNTYPDFSDFIFEADETRIRPTIGSELLVLAWALEQAWSFQAATHDSEIKERLLLRDHGFCQFSISIFAYRESEVSDLDSHLKTYFSSIPLPRYLVVIRASQQSATSRLGVRGYPERMRRLSSETKKTILARAARCIDIGVEQLRRRGTTVYEIDNNGSPSQLNDEAVSVVGKIAAFGR